MILHLLESLSVPSVFILHFEAHVATVQPPRERDQIFLGLKCKLLEKGFYLSPVSRLEALSPLGEHCEEPTAVTMSAGGRGLSTKVCTSERGGVGEQWGGMLVGRELSNHCESFIFSCEMSPSQARLWIT